jgi:hypothetical protein
MRFVSLTMVKAYTVTSWVMTLYSLVDSYVSFSG